MIKLCRQDSCASRRHTSLLLLLAAFCSQVSLHAGTLQPETLAAWNLYVQTASARVSERVLSGHCFLFIDESPVVAGRVRSGEPFVIPLTRSPQKVPGGLVHDWIGTTFIPNASLDAVLSTIRDYAHYKDFYHPSVMDSRLIASTASKDRFTLLLTSKSLVSKAALDGDYESSYVRVDDRHWYSVSETTRLQEIESYGTPEQRTLIENEGSGLLWRLFTISRYEQRDGGVYIETEAIALSRDIPGSLKWLVAPIVRRVSKAALLTSLQETSDAVLNKSSLIAHSPERRERSPAPSANATLSLFNSLH